MCNELSRELLASKRGLQRLATAQGEGAANFGTDIGEHDTESMAAELRIRRRWQVLSSPRSRSRFDLGRDFDGKFYSQSQTEVIL